jgi:protein-tyrosine phosphatase
VRWPDWWLPADRADTYNAWLEVWRRAESARVEVACSGGQGRTGAALAWVAILDGVPAADAVAYVRQHYNQRSRLESNGGTSCASKVRRACA